MLAGGSGEAITRGRLQAVGGVGQWFRNDAWGQKRESGVDATQTAAVCVMKDGVVSSLVCVFFESHTAARPLDLLMSHFHCDSRMLQCRIPRGGESSCWHLGDIGDNGDIGESLGT